MEENGERKRKAKRHDMRSDKRALRLGPAIRTKASSVMSLREAPRSSIMTMMLTMWIMVMTMLTVAML